MGLLDLFKKKEIFEYKESCDLCKKSENYKRLFGMVRQREMRKDPEVEQKLCRDCFFSKFDEILQYYSNEVIVFAPGKNDYRIAYGFVEYDLLARVIDDKNEFENTKNLMKELAQNSQNNCLDCGKDAKITWCDFGDDTFELINLFDYKEFQKDSKKITTTKLCNKCFGERVKKIIVENDLAWENFYLPTSQEGFFIASEVYNSTRHISHNNH